MPLRLGKPWLALGGQGHSSVLDAHLFACVVFLHQRATGHRFKEA